MTAKTPDLFHVHDRFRDLPRVFLRVDGGDPKPESPPAGYNDPNRPRNVRLGASKYGPWVNRPEEGNAA